MPKQNSRALFTLAGAVGRAVGKNEFAFTPTRLEIAIEQTTTPQRAMKINIVFPTFFKEVRHGTIAEL